MKRFLSIFLLVFVVSVYCFSHEHEIHILFSSEDQQNFYRNYFQLNNIEYDEDGLYTKIAYNIDVLKNILQIEKLKIDVIRNNIENAATTRTSTGRQFQRQYIDISPEDGIVINVDTAEGLRKYDPIHPDAASDGFVIYPNIDLAYEHYTLNNSIYLFNSVVDYIQRNNIEIIVDKLPSNSLEELNHQRTMERIIGVYLRIFVDELNRK